MIQITRLTVGKGRTREVDDGKAWNREYYELEISVDDATEVEIARANALGLIDGWLSQPAPSPKPAAKSEIFPKDLADLLTFEHTSDYIIIKPKAFLGSENFAKIVHIVRTNKGEYVSAGKDSHFKIPKNP